MNDGPRIRGMTASIPYLLDRYGIAPEVTIQTHADYYTIYDAKGVPFSRVMFSGGVFGMRELMSGKSEQFNALAPALKAARAGLTDQPPKFGFHMTFDPFDPLPPPSMTAPTHPANTRGRKGCVDQ